MFNSRPVSVLRRVFTGNVSLAVNQSAPHEAGGQDRLQVVSVVPLETSRRPLGVRFRFGLAPGQATDRTSNAIDIAIAITGFIT